MRAHVIFLPVAAALAACSMMPQSPPAYPAARREAVTDTYHGQQVADPYRWMEQGGEEVAAWVRAQNALSGPYLEGIPARAGIRDRLTALWDYDQYGYPWMGEKSRVPVRRGGRYFFVEKSGSQNQGLLYWTPQLDTPPRVLLDPNGLSADATVSVADFVVSPDGRYLAYSVSEGGSDWDSWRIREVDTGQDLPDLIRDTKFTRVSWTPDASAFYYSRYPRDAAGRADDQRQVSVYRHRLGAMQQDDELVYAVTGHARRNPYAQLSADGRWLLLNITLGFESNAYYLQDLSRPDAPVQRLLDAWDGLYEFLGAQDGLLYFKTTQGAPRGRVVAIDPARPEPAQWCEVVPERDATLHQASLVGGLLIANHLDGARSRVRVYRLDGTLRNEVRLPGQGTVAGFPDAADETETFFSYTDYLTPLALYRYRADTDSVTQWRKPQVAFDAAPYVTEQAFATSRDGTRVPVFITRSRQAQAGGDHPVLLYGYGGFDVSLTPAYSPVIAAWLERGGVYVVANLRGGGEFGADWHLAGTRTRKQNVFDDYIAVAEWLIAERITSSARLALHGGSNGGLLVAAVMAQRPELFGAVLPTVGVLDMLRYHTASANAYAWSSDYGTVEDAAEFRALAAYSPVHNLVRGRCYPPTLVTTADHDDRVVPWHSYKFAAALQYAQGCNHPALILVETRAGHGAGKPTWMQVEDWANKWAFLVRQLGMPGGS